MKAWNTSVPPSKSLASKCKHIHKKCVYIHHSFHSHFFPLTFEYTLSLSFKMNGLVQMVVHPPQASIHDHKVKIPTWGLPCQDFTLSLYYSCYYFLIDITSFVKLRNTCKLPVYLTFSSPNALTLLFL